MVVDVRLDKETSSLGGRFIDRDLIFFPWGEGAWRAFAPIPVGARVGDRELVVEIELENGTKKRSSETVRVKAHDFDESHLSVDPKFIQPPDEERERIRRERRMIREAFSESADERLWRYPFVRSAEGRRTGRFGTRRLFNGELRSRHMGLDLDGSPGDPILAMSDGRVVLVHHLYYAGKAVFIDHGHEMFTVYFHLQDFEVEVGDEVSAGQRIGTIGATGRVTGPHLHLGVRLQGRYVNPESFLELDIGPDPKARR